MDFIGEHMLDVPARAAAGGGQRVKRPSVLLGLDGATFTVLDPLMRDGRDAVPGASSSLGGRARGCASVIPALTPPAWTSLMTGRAPGHHGIFDFFRKESRDSQHIRFATSRDVACETIWSWPTAAGVAPSA